MAIKNDQEAYTVENRISLLKNDLERLDNTNKGCAGLLILAVLALIVLALLGRLSSNLNSVIIMVIVLVSFGAYFRNRQANQNKATELEAEIQELQRELDRYYKKGQ